ncbi:ABC transporter ATP-binding protein [Zunongwangia endophytica]|uniref:ABC transporter ATP-binding protein n=1 Tax=Zunongwangia endophytica TaxID=1808945 RepID=A0ABV8H9D7_9FLAO|nr:ABC transporter ATP-binding protein [Zunongwangia endophytica]MDN3593872.1 ABC transporter ATP-binding protein [Zunongwangia endophytica]
MSTVSQNITLKTTNLEIGYAHKNQRKTIAKNINIEAQSSELIAVIGVNGIGKSTFLRSISGIQEPLSGEITIGEHKLKELNNLERASQIGLVLTNQPISKNLSVFELIALGRQPYTNWLGKLSENDREKIENVINLTSIKDLRNRKCYELSDGQLQRVLIARSIAQNTPIIILDEPTTHLDMYHKANVFKLLKELVKQTEKTIIFASHEINLAIQICDKIILMHPDKTQIDTPKNLISKGMFQDLFPKELIHFDEISSSFRIKNKD